MNRGNRYIPMDWRVAIANDDVLAENQVGSVLFADVSGFTALTETFARELGSKRGAEEFTLHLNQIFYGIVRDLHDYGGSVVSFSGDAMTCWFNNDLDGRKAITSALAMQKTMNEKGEITTYSQKTVKLGIKLAVSTGMVRRFLVGLPEYLTHDAMAGRTLERVTAAESMAEKGDVILDEQTVLPIQDQLEIIEWRTNEETGEKFALIAGLSNPAEQNPWPKLPNTIDQETVSEWILPSVFDRLNEGDGEFLSQLRPTLAMFIRFSGIDYDRDPEASQKLNRFMCHLQRIMMRFGGNLLQLTIGDKGSYVYASFGAPRAHEDDAQRAGSAALELIQTSDQFEFDQKVQVGIAYGNNWSGAYGGEDRITYGVMGNSVNLAARLMIKCKPGQILLDKKAQQKLEEEFVTQPLGMVRFKGKSYKTEVFELISPMIKSGFHLFDASYRFPMVGRESELEIIKDKMDLALQGYGQTVGITAEAGMGKSRLAAEASQIANTFGMKTFGSECESFGTNNSYLVWENIWRDIFGMSIANTPEEQIAYLSSQLSAAGPDLVARLPLLTQLVKINIPDNELTASLDPKAKKAALESLLVDYLRYEARQTPILLLLEDIHWIDDLSKDLLELIISALEQEAVMILMVYRPPNQQVVNRVPDFTQLPNFTELALDQFSQEEIAILIRHKLAQFFQSYNIPKKLLDLVVEKSGGNPFYIEEILNFIKDLNIDIHDADSLEELDLPDTIHSLILSRLDRLTQGQQNVIRVASVIGRLFRSAMVHGVYPGQPIQEQIEEDLKALFDLDLTSVEKNEPEETYLFKHIVTQEVTYESLPFKTRSVLHERAGEYLEKHQSEGLDQFIDLLAFHFSHSENHDKKKKYLLRAGELAQETFANAAALDYFKQVSPLLDETEMVEIELKMGEVYVLIGQMDEAEKLYTELLAKIKEDPALNTFLPKAQMAFGEMRRKQGEFGKAAPYLNDAHSNAEEINDQQVVAKTLLCLGTLNAQQGELNNALELYQKSIDLHRSFDDEPNIANILNNMGVVAEYLGNFTQAKSWFEESLEIRERNGLRSVEAISLSNTANMMIELGETEEAVSFYEKALNIQRQTGNQWAIGNTLNNMGNAARELGENRRASEIYWESLGIYKDLRDKWALTFLLEDIAVLFANQSLAKKALFLAGSADNLRKEINSPLSDVLQEKLEDKLKRAKHKLGDKVANQAWIAGRKLELDDAINIALDQLAKSGIESLPDFDGAVSFALNIIRNELDPVYVYHNITHTESDVMPNAARLAELCNLSDDEKRLLRVAASFHDVGYLKGPTEHEARSCDVVRKHLPTFNFSAEQIEAICEMIMATRIPQTPINLMGQILADADLDLLGRTDFPDVSNRLRLELENTGNDLTDAKWYAQQIGFLKSHSYFTEAAIDTRQPQKEANINWLEQSLAKSAES